MRTCTDPNNCCPALNPDVAALITLGEITTAEAAKLGLCARCLLLIEADARERASAALALEQQVAEQLVEQAPVVEQTAAPTTAGETAVDQLPAAASADTGDGDPA